jgi:hypothetical protein
MDSTRRNQILNTFSHAADCHLSEIDRMRAIEGMNQAMVLGNLAIAAFGHARRSLRALRNAAARIAVPR